MTVVSMCHSSSARVVRDYADQAEAVAAARARLAALELEPTPASPALHTEVVWEEARCVSAQGDVSPDGRLLTYVDWCDRGNLAPGASSLRNSCALARRERKDIGSSPNRHCH